MFILSVHTHVRYQSILVELASLAVCLIFPSLVLSSCSGLLESLCYLLYDTLRPVVIHINHLETLAELCSIFKVGGAAYVGG